jgi:putative ABC transport system substrate-binding protein
VRAAEEAGERLAIKAMAAGVGDVAEIEAAIVAMAGLDDGGLMVLPGIRDIPTIITLAAKYRVPAIYPDRRYAADGGLMSYGPYTRLQFRDGATYVDRILRGAKVNELPVQFASNFELVINLKTAKALGLDVSPQLQLLANEVIR